MLTQFKISSFLLSFLSKNLKGKIGSITNIELVSQTTSLYILFLKKTYIFTMRPIIIVIQHCAPKVEREGKRGVDRQYP